MSNNIIQKGLAFVCEQSGSPNLFQQAGADELIDNLSGGFALNIRRQFKGAIIALRSRGQNDELRMGLPRRHPAVPG
jgi:hypothetical protein